MGRRDVLNHQPCGWGVLYDSDNRMVYEGFQIGSKSVCYGRSYYQDIQKVEYEGGLCNGCRWGEGTLYDRNGAVVYKGQWMNDEHEFEKSVVLERYDGGFPMLHSLITYLGIDPRCCRFPEWKSVDFSCFPNLKELEVEEGCFEYVREVRMVELKKLEKVVDWKRLFQCREHAKEWVLPEEMRGVEGTDDWKQLIPHYRKCEIVNNSSLESIAMEKDAFYSSNSILKSVLSPSV